MVARFEASSVLQRMLDSNEVHPPAEFGMPAVIVDLAPHIASLSDLLLAERKREQADDRFSFKFG